MADSLLFDGVDDKINFSIGGVPTIGPGMLAAIVKSAGVGGSNDIIMHNTSWDLYRHTGGTFRWWNGSAEHVGPSLSDGVWYLVSMTKASGTVATPLPCLQLQHRYLDACRLGLDGGKQDLRLDLQPRRAAEDPNLVADIPLEHGLGHGGGIGQERDRRDPRR
jgi:hypothetical protein